MKMMLVGDGFVNGVVSCDMYAPISRVEIITQQYSIHVKRETKAERRLQVRDAYLNRIMRTSCVKYTIHFSKDFDQERLNCFND